MAKQSRRSFLTLLASVPLLGRLAPKAASINQGALHRTISIEDWPQPQGMVPAQYIGEVTLDGQRWTCWHAVGLRDERHTDGVVSISATRVD